MRCAVCGAGSPRLKHHVAEAEIFRCGRCGLEFWNPAPGFRAEEVYDAAYFSDASAGHGYDDYADLESVLRLNFARRLARIPRSPHAGRLLDIGAAFGFAVAEARCAGWDATGIEISVAAARRAGTAAPGRVLVANALHTPFAAAAFDVVTLWDVLEHLSDPHAAIAEVARLLRPGGRLALTTGDVGSLAARLSGARWHLYTLPEHLFFFSRRSLRELLGAHGLRVESVRAESSLYTAGYLVERLRKTLLGKPRTRTGAWPGAALRVPLNLFDIVTVQAVAVGSP
ncbi:MAG: class I SAM-dependent methyltransferase [Deltaproteobacteria bacterium]|nr:class I SAM-dependent methyltransferase [Deltaproteobacteria bacterium]